MKKLKQKYRCMDDRKYGNRKTTGCPTKTFGHDRLGGFTLVELVIVIAIVIILSVISVPIYRGYVDKSKMAEGYALLGAILSAQKAYYSEYGNFLRDVDIEAGTGDYTSYNPLLGVDARGNKYFTWFAAGHRNVIFPKYYTSAGAKLPEELIAPGKSSLYLQYNITKGAKIVIYPQDYDSSWTL